MLSASSVEWIDEAMAHNNAHDGEQWMRQRTREAHQAFDRLRHDVHRRTGARGGRVILHRIFGLLRATPVDDAADFAEAVDTYRDTLMTAWKDGYIAGYAACCETLDGLLVKDRALDAVDALAAMRNASAQLAAHHDQTPGGTEQQ